MDFKEREEEVNMLREKGLPTLPVRMGSEKKVNLFLRAPGVKEFEVVRRRKDNW